jgi:hypothetical protein
MTLPVNLLGVDRRGIGYHRVNLAFATIVEGAMLLASGRGTPDMLQVNGQ